MRWLVILIIISNFVYSQVSVERAGLYVGIERNHHFRFLSNSTFGVVGEFVLGGMFYKTNIEWEGHISVWDDGVSKNFNCVDCAQISFNGANFGIRINYSPTLNKNKLVFPIYMVAGFSIRYIKEELSEIDFYAEKKEFILPSVDMGLGVKHNFSKSIRVRANAILSIPFRKKVDDLATEGRGLNIKIGCDYFFNGILLW